MGATQYKSQGFTLVETMVTMAVLIFIFVLAGPIFRSFQRGLDAQNEARNISGAIRYAQNRTLASEGASQYGVYFSTSSDPQFYTIFRGSSYGSRSVADDIIREFSDVEISEVDFNGGAELVFDRISGLTEQAGNMTIFPLSDPADTAIIYVNRSGQVSVKPFTASTSEASRLADSRHVHFTYSRNIDVNEHIFLKLGTTTIDLLISDNMVGTDLYYNESVDINGDIEPIIIRTTRLNDPDTEFCIHRGRDSNNLQLDVDLSGDLGSSPNLISFSADGLTVSTGTSIFAGGPVWQ